MPLPARSVQRRIRLHTHRDAMDSVSAPRTHARAYKPGPLPQLHASLGLDARHGHDTREWVWPRAEMGRRSGRSAWRCPPTRHEEVEPGQLGAGGEEGGQEVEHVIAHAGLIIAPAGGGGQQGRIFRDSVSSWPAHGRLSSSSGRPRRKRLWGQQAAGLARTVGQRMACLNQHYCGTAWQKKASCTNIKLAGFLSTIS